MLKTVIIGCGNIAGGYDASASSGEWPLTHAGAFSAHGGFDLIACCDPESKKRKEFQHKWTVRQSASHPENLNFSEHTIDVVSICSPTSLHTQHLETALKWKPKLLFCEKPVTLSVEETDYWVQRYADAGILFIVNHNRRWAPDVLTLKEDLAQQKWGAVRSLTATYNKGILNNGSHMVDLIHFLLGTIQLIAAGDEVYDHWPNDPSIPALLKTDTGIPVTLNIANAQDYTLFELQLVTEKGVLRMESGGLSWSSQRVIDSPDFPGYRTLSTASRKEGRYREAMSCAVENIYNVLASGGAIPSTGATALQAQRICRQILQHSQTITSYSGIHK